MQILSSGLPQWLRMLPHLATVYVKWSNRMNRRVITGLSLGVTGAAVAAMWLVWIGRARLAAAFEDLHGHRVLIALLAAVVAALTLARQRRVMSERAPRSWVASLPMNSRARLVESLILQLAPVIAWLAGVLGFGLLMGTFLGIGGLAVNGCLFACRWFLVGTLLGTAVGLAVPLPRPVIPYPGSRYVPHRVSRGRRPVPSVGPLGVWPIRRMFAKLEPKTLSRTLLPVLVMMPMGSAAATAMILIGVLLALLAFVFLVHSVAWVLNVARRWLSPLPISLRRLSWVVTIPSLMVMGGLGAVAKWLTWAGGQ